MGFTSMAEFHGLGNLRRNRNPQPETRNPQPESRLRLFGAGRRVMKQDLHEHLSTYKIHAMVLPRA